MTLFHRKSYRPDFKHQFIAYDVLNKNSKTAKYYNIDLKNVRNLKKEIYFSALSLNSRAQRRAEK